MTFYADIMGCPITIGRVKRRVVKKYEHDIFRVPADVAALGVGDWYNDCSGFNKRIAEIRPDYTPVQRCRYHPRRNKYRGLNALVLTDITIVGEDGSHCSLLSCGVTAKVPREIVESRYIEFLRTWTLSDGGQTWYGDDFPAVQKKTKAFLDYCSAGHHFTDEDGRKALSPDLLNLFAEC